MISELSQLAVVWMKKSDGGKGLRLTPAQLDLLNAIGVGELIASAAAKAVTEKCQSKRSLSIKEENTSSYRIDDATPRLYFRSELQKVRDVDADVPVGTRPSGWDDPSRIVTGTKVDDSAWGRSDEAYVPPAAVAAEQLAPRLRRSSRNVGRVDYRPPDYSAYF